MLTKRKKAIRISKKHDSKLIWKKPDHRRQRGGIAGMARTGTKHLGEKKKGREVNTTP